MIRHDWYNITRHDLKSLALRGTIAPATQMLSGAEESTHSVPEHGHEQQRGYHPQQRCPHEPSAFFTARQHQHEGKKNLGDDDDPNTSHASAIAPPEGVLITGRSVGFTTARNGGNEPDFECARETSRYPDKGLETEFMSDAEQPHTFRSFSTATCNEREQQQTQQQQQRQWQEHKHSHVSSSPSAHIHDNSDTNLESIILGRCSSVRTPYERQLRDRSVTLNGKSVRNRTVREGQLRYRSGHDHFDGHRVDLDRPMAFTDRVVMKPSTRKQAKSTIQSTSRRVTDPRVKGYARQSLGSSVLNSGSRTDVDDGRFGFRQDRVEDIFSYARHNHVQDLERMMDGGVPADVRDAYGNTTLIVACQNGHKRVLKAALRRGADPNAVNHKGNTALHHCYAFGYGNTLAQYLMQKGADSSLRNRSGQVCYDGIGP